MTIRNIILGLGISALTLSASAQTLEKEILITRDIEPAERAASRLGTVTPGIYRPDIKPYRLSSLVPVSPYAPYRGVATLEPVAWGDTFAVSPYRGYLTVGYLPAFNLGVSAGYRFISKPRTQVGLWLQYDGESYKGRITPQAEKSTLKSNIFAVGLDAAHSLKSARLSGDVKCRFGSATAPMATNDPTFTQGFKQFDVDLKALGTSKRLPWRAGVSFEHFGFNNDVMRYDATFKPVSQNVLALMAGVDRRWATAAVGVDARFDLQANSAGNRIGIAYDSYTKAQFGVNPHLDFTAGRFSGRLGVNLDLGAGVYVAPDVRLVYKASDFVVLQADATGGKQFNNLSTLYDINPRMAGMANANMTRVPVDAMARVVVGPRKGLFIEVHGGWARAEDVAMASALHGYSIWKSYDMSAFTGGLKASWTYADRFEVHAGFDAAQHSSINRMYYKWHDGASLVANAGFEVRPLDRLRAGIDWQLRSGRRYFGYNPVISNTQSYDLGQLNNLSLHANYAVTDWFDLGLNLDNLLCRRWYTVPGAQSPSIHGLLSAALKF